MEIIRIYGNSLQLQVSLNNASDYWTNGLYRTPNPNPSPFFARARRHGSNTPVLQETLENVLTATIVLTSTLVVLEVTSVT